MTISVSQNQNRRMPKWLTKSCEEHAEHFVGSSPSPAANSGSDRQQVPSASNVKRPAGVCWRARKPRNEMMANAGVELQYDDRQGRCAGSWIFSGDAR